MSKRDGPTTANNFVRSVRTTRRVRRATSLAILGAGLMTLISALTPSFANRLHYLDQVMPVVVHQAAFAVTVVIGVALIQLAGGVRRGQRRSWLLSVLMLIVAAVLHLVKGLDAEEATVSAVLATVLVMMRRHFRAPSDPAANLWRGRLRIVGSVAVALVAASLSVAGVRRHSLGVGGSFRAVLERVVGNRSVVIGGRLDRFISPALGALGLTLVAFALWALLRPSRTGGPVSADAATARRIIAEHGDDTLAYFALRSDKQRWVFGETLIAYAVINNTCLVSPDPIGPPEELIDAWASFNQVVADRGWALAVLGASSEWRDRYEAFGMRSMYVGDEAIVDVDKFSLNGGEMKGLRQAANRVANKGYSISFHDPATIDPAFATDLRLMMVESRRGQVERGFSMTLSRLFEPDDTGLLLAVCHGPDGEPVAFCQFVPAGDDGYSLDLMRRSNGDHPNGLTDFVLVKTIEHLRSTPRTLLSLNFATMRAVLAGERGAGLGQSIQRGVLGRMGETMQIESLWRYNAKFLPIWVPRYLVYDTTEHLATIGLAVAKAESFWELPLIGGLMMPPRSADAPPNPAGRRRVTTRVKSRTNKRPNATEAAR